MRAELRKLWSLELEENFDDYAPSDVDVFGTWVRVEVGPVGNPGTDSFEIFICTPRWLSDAVKAGPILGRYYLFIDSFDLEAIRKKLSSAIGHLSASDWPGLVKQLSCLGAWEFDEYKSQSKNQ